MAIANIPGTLYMVATPIGNLGDISDRARMILKEVDFIACEDTRHSGRLLAKIDVSKPLVALHAHNEDHQADILAQRILAGESCAYISDAGTPGVSDPGTILVGACRAHGVKVRVVPGASALASVMSICPFPGRRTLFEGFLPKTEKKLAECILDWEKIHPAKVVFYESPNRVASTLRKIMEFYGEGTPVLAARELTKLHEEHLLGTCLEVVEELSHRERILGEFVVCVDIHNKSLAELSKPKLEAYDVVQQAVEAYKHPHNREKLKRVVKSHAKKNTGTTHAIFTFCVLRN